MTMSQERSQYGVKIGAMLYVEHYGCDGDVDVTADRCKAFRWDLAAISGAASIAKHLGGRVVRFKVRRKEVVVGERDGNGND